MLGLGDNIYQRAFLTKTNQPVYISTPWPELYQDLHHVHCVKPMTKLRTQYKNICATQHQFSGYHGAINKRVRYGSDGIHAGMKKVFGYNPDKMTLPDFGDPEWSKTPYVVVRPVTIREEWRAESRNPDPEYVNQAAQAAMDAGFVVISVADIDDNNEYAVGALPNCNVRFNKGELGVEELLSLTQNAAGVIGGIGWIVPASIAQGVKCLAICGGYGAYNRPQNLIPIGGCDNVTFAVPDKMCNCSLMNHKCNKTISRFDEILDKWISEL